MQSQSGPNTLISDQPDTPLVVGGFIPLATGDFPGHLSAVIFCQGCPWRCRYCHNPHLQLQNQETGSSWTDVLNFLKRRVGLLDAVVFSGGEPTCQPGIQSAVSKVRDLGFKIGLHTAGVSAKGLASVLPSIDWVGLDIKALPDDYPAITGSVGSALQPFESLSLLLQNKVEFEVRTTFHPHLMNEAQLLKLARTLSAMGVTTFAVQQFRNTGCQDDELNQLTSQRLSAETAASLESMFDRTYFRGD